MPLAPDHPLLRETIAHLERLVALPTVSGDSNLEMIQLVSDILESSGAEVQTWSNPEGNRANLIARIGPDADGGIMLAGHSDVVPVVGQQWQYEPFQLTEADNRLFGRGTCDMKGFIACAIAMASEFAILPAVRPIYIAVTYDEETGCLGGLQLADDLENAGIRPTMCIVGEPTSMQVIEGHKGCYEYTTRFEGLAAHGSLTHVGVNAVEYAARYVVQLMELREKLKNSAPAATRFEPPYTTLQIGQIAGGISRNTIAGDCRIEWEMRPVQRGDADFIKDNIADFADNVLLPEMRERFPDAAIELETIGEIAGLSPASAETAARICCGLTGNDGTGVVSFGTEAGIYADSGISTVVCGPGSIDQAHKPDEFIEVDELGRCLNMLEALKAQLIAS